MVSGHRNKNGENFFGYCTYIRLLTARDCEHYVDEDGHKNISDVGWWGLARSSVSVQGAGGGVEVWALCRPVKFFLPNSENNFFTERRFVFACLKTPWLACLCMSQSTYRAGLDGWVLNAHSVHFHLKVIINWRCEDDLWPGCSCVTGGLKYKSSHIPANISVWPPGIDFIDVFIFIIPQVTRCHNKFHTVSLFHMLS